MSLHKSWRLIQVKISSLAELTAHATFRWGLFIPLMRSPADLDRAASWTALPRLQSILSTSSHYLLHADRDPLEVVFTHGSPRLKRQNRFMSFNMFRPFQQASRNTSSPQYAYVYLQITGGPLTSCESTNALSLKLLGLRFKLWIAYCRLAGVNERTKLDFLMIFWQSNKSADLRWTEKVIQTARGERLRALSVLFIQSS